MKLRVMVRSGESKSFICMIIVRERLEILPAIPIIIIVLNANIIIVHADLLSNVFNSCLDQRS